MSQAPMMPIYPDALLGDTLHLSAEQLGAYLLLLFATWRNNGKPLADDDRKLARICRSTTAHWRRALRPTLIEFFQTDDGFLHQKRLESEWNRIHDKIMQNKFNGSSGGAASALKSRQSTISERSSERYSERYSERSSECVANALANPDPDPEPRRSQEKNLKFKTSKGDLGCAPRAHTHALAREAPSEPHSAEDIAAADALVAGVLATLALPPSGLRNGTYDEAAYRQAITDHKREVWLNNLAHFAGQALPGLPEKEAAWEAIEAARAAGSRARTPPDVRRALDALSRLRDTSAAYAEAAE